MPEIIECPQCQRKLRLEESVLGQLVQCPSCQNTFTAEKPRAPTSAYQPLDDDPPPRPRYDEPARPRYDEPPSRRRYEEDEDYPSPKRRRHFDDDYQKPHRGSTIQTLGILAVVFCFCAPLPGLILAIVTIVWASNDLSAMRRGQMDESGAGSTKVGLTCGIIAIVLDGLGLVACIGMAILDEM